MAGKKLSKRLTARAIERIRPPKSGRAEHWDDLVKGFGLRVTEKGNRSFVVLTRIGGRKLIRVTLRQPVVGPDYGVCLKKARAEATLIIEAARRGEDPRLKLRGEEPETVAKAAEKFLDRYVRHEGLRSGDEIERLFRKDILPVIGNRPLVELDRADMHRVLDKVSKRAPVLANRVYAALSRFTRWLVEYSHIPASPLTGVPKPLKTEKRRDRVLAPLEIKQLWAAWERQQYPFGSLCMLLIMLGQRRQETAGMRWSDIDLEGDDPIWTIPKEIAKNGIAHVVPLPEPVAELLKALPQRGPYVFSTSPRGDRPVSGFSRAKAITDRIVAKDGEELSDWRWHDLRRTVASGIAEAGYSVQVLAKVLNHSDRVVSGITSVYNQHQYRREKRDALTAWTNRLKTMVKTDNSNVVRLHR